MTNHTLAHPRQTPAKSPSNAAIQDDTIQDDAIQTVTADTFAKLVLDAQGPCAVEFMSYGCAHCREIEPVLEQVAKMVEAREKIFRVNVAVEEELASTYQIQGTPTFVMFLNQNEVGRVEGPSPTVASVLAAVTQPFEP
jgi:thioredoxin 1